IAALPLFLCLRQDTGRLQAARLARALRGPGLYALALPLGAILAALVARYPGPQNIVDDWAHLLYYFLFFIYGYLIHVADGVWGTIERRRRTSLTLAFVSMVVIDAIRWNGASPDVTYSIANTLYQML